MHLPNMITRLSRYHYFICTLGNAEMVFSVPVKGHALSLWSWYEKLLTSGVLSVHQSKDGVLSSSAVYMPVKSARQSGAGRLGLFSRAGKTQAAYCPLKWDMQRDMLSITKPPRMSYVFLREKRQRKTETRHCHRENWKRIKYCGLRSCC